MRETFRAHLLVLVLLLLAGCAPVVPGPAVATGLPATSPAATAAEQVFLPSVIGAQTAAADTQGVPTCPAPSQTVDVAPQYYGRGVGGSPVWMIAGGDDLTWSMADVRQGTLAEHGYQHKVLWVIEKVHAAIVTLHGGNLDSGEPLWFQVGSEEPSTAPALDPANPGAYSNPEYADFPSYLLVPGLGCYFLEASWAGGSWRANLTVTE